MKPLLACLFALAAVSALPALDARVPSDPAARGGDQGTLKKVETDSKDDGFIDDVMYFSEKGQKVREEFDFNRDGTPDDFLHFENGVLIREEIDTHFNGRIDVWIHLSRGVYVERYERDLDGDGIPDVVKDFAGKK